MTLQSILGSDRQRRALAFCAGAAVLGAVMGVVAKALQALIQLITNIAFFGRWSFAPASPAGHHLGWLMPLVPLAGAVIVGLMARYGSRAICGHGIPEAMEQVLLNKSRIPARLFILKPLSAAVSIGTGGPFGAEGPIIATGGSLGSIIGQLISTTPIERKTLLAAGAAAGMAGTFGCPISATILAVELLLFEFHARSMIPVALASAAAAAVRLHFEGAPAFALPAMAAPTMSACLFYCVLGGALGAVAALITRACYAVEDAFEHLPIHWMWWPAVGALAIGAFGLIEPRTLGVGYNNIIETLSGTLITPEPLRLALLKFGSWVIALGSGTSGGTLAPLMTIGAGFGAAATKACLAVWPALTADPRMGALVGMAALFAGASGATLAAAVFAVETTLQVSAVVPLLGGCAAAHLAARLLWPNTIMTEKIVRRGVRIPEGYTSDPLARHLAGEAALEPVGEVEAGEPSIAASATLREAAALLARRNAPRLLVVTEEPAPRVLGALTRHAVLDAYRHDEDHHESEVSWRPRLR
jgi:H+/Cl- antiporter ClcA